MLTALLRPPTDIVLSVDSNDIVVSFTEAASVDSYNIYVSIDGGAWALSGSTTSSPYSFTPTEPGEYNFYLTSVRGAEESEPTAETLYDEMMTQVYTDTLSPRISAVDGTAFVDAASDITTYADGNHLLEIEDSLGNVASGVLSEQGSGETLGSELVTNVVNSSGIYAFETFTLNANGRDIDSAINTTDNGFAATNEFGTLGQLFKTVAEITLNSGTYPALSSRKLSGANSQIIANPLLDGNYYRTWANISGEDDNGLVVHRSAATDFSLVWSSKQVTAPSTSGALIVSEIDGATQNFFTVPAGFTFNQSSYICRVKKILPTA